MSALYGTVTRIWDAGESPLPGYTRVRLTMEVPDGLEFAYFHNGAATNRLAPTSVPFSALMGETSTSTNLSAPGENSFQPAIRVNFRAALTKSSERTAQCSTTTAVHRLPAERQRALAVGPMSRD
jgi:hypothetical protein